LKTSFLKIGKGYQKSKRRKLFQDIADAGCKAIQFIYNQIAALGILTEDFEDWYDSKKVFVRLTRNSMMLSTTVVLKAVSCPNPLLRSYSDFPSILNPQWLYNR